MKLESTIPFCKIRPAEITLVGILLVFSVFVHYGRVGMSIGGVNLATDTANYAAIAAAMTHPEAFARDDALSDPRIYRAHSTFMDHIVARLADNDNYGLAYLKLTGVHVFLHYLAFYILGLALFKKRWQALIFTILQGQIYWTFWGTYWGGGYIDYLPRTTFEIVYALYILVALSLLQRPRWWPVFMAATGLLIYVHSISSLPVALGFWLGFALHKPHNIRRIQHMAWMFLCGLCFLATAAPMILIHGAPLPVATAEDLRMVHEVLLTRFDAEYTYYWQSIGRFFLHHTLLPLFPLALLGVYCIRRWGDVREKLIMGQFGMWTLGVFGVLAIFLIDQEVSRILQRHHYEIDLIRALRFLIFFAQCVALMGLCVAIRAATGWRGWQQRGAVVLYTGLCVGLFLGGHQDMVRASLLWYWNKTSPERMEAAYGVHLRRAAMVDALKIHTEPGTAIFYPREDLAIRFIALRSLTHSWKDVGAFYNSKNIPKLRKWLATHTAIHASPTAYIDVARHSGADYVLSHRPQDAPLLAELGTIVWEGEGYLLVQMAKATYE